MVVNSVQTITDVPQSVSGSKSISKDDFLKILVTQLKYQNPLDPLKPDELLVQLAQLTEVEKLQNLENLLEEMKGLLKGQDVSGWANLIGKKVMCDDTVLSKGDEVSLTPVVDFDQIILAVSDVNDGNIKTITFEKGDTLVYRHEDDNDVKISVAALKNGKLVECGMNVFRTVRGLVSDNGKMYFVFSNGQKYSTESIKEIRE